MFEVTFANWAPSCRLLVDNVSEAYALFFVVYRCVIGFAVLSVVSVVAGLLAAQLLPENTRSVQFFSLRDICRDRRSWHPVPRRIGVSQHLSHLAACNAASSRTALGMQDVGSGRT